MKQLITVLAAIFVGALFITATPQERVLYQPTPTKQIIGRRMLNGDIVEIVKHDDGMITYRKLFK